MFMRVRDAPTLDDALVYNKVCAEADLVVPETMCCNYKRPVKNAGSQLQMNAVSEVLESY